jgi:hypothetical protein
MNGLSRKLHALEDNLLEFPPDDDDILLHVGESDEYLLHDRAQKIRDTFKDDAEKIINDETLTFKKANELSEHLINRISAEDKAILEKSYDFMSYRTERLVYKWFAAGYPNGQDTRVMLRVMWFFREMQKLNHVNQLEDAEWNTNRNEDDPAFDDDAWWNAVDAKKRELYPEGVFTEKSFEEFERLHDEFVSRKIKEYYDAHPEEREALVRGLNKKSEEQRKNE